MTPEPLIPSSDKPEEACGVFGLYAPERDVARLTFFGLYALQHRGQESAGIAVGDGDSLTVVKDVGLVSQVFNDRMLGSLPGELALGHVRYSTTGASEWRNAQPMVREWQGHTFALGHNGNLVNAAQLREELQSSGEVFSSTSDTEVIAALISTAQAPDLVQATIQTMPLLKGAYSVAMACEGKIIGFRDPHGVRPLCLGVFPAHEGVPDRYVIASESCALDIIGAKFHSSVAPGEVVVLSSKGLSRHQAVLPASPQGFCIFEMIYFARPDSVISSHSVYAARRRMGEELAREAPASADLVIGVPDTGTPAATGYAAVSGIPYAEGLIKNRYVGRTFIAPDDDLRQRGIRMKLNPVVELIQGKRLVVIDDSIVRGSTTRQIVKMLFEAGAREVHVRISSPPITHGCYYGIDTGRQGELIAANATVSEIARHIAASSLAYLSLDGLQKASGFAEKDVCRACLTGNYPIAITPFKTAKHLFEPQPAST